MASVSGISLCSSVVSRVLYLIELHLLLQWKSYASSSFSFRMRGCSHADYLFAFHVSNELCVNLFEWRLVHRRSRCDTSSLGGHYKTLHLAIWWKISPRYSCRCFYKELPRNTYSLSSNHSLFWKKLLFNDSGRASDGIVEFQKVPSFIWYEVPIM